MVCSFVYGQLPKGVFLCLVFQDITFYFNVGKYITCSVLKLEPL